MIVESRDAFRRRAPCSTVLQKLGDWCQSLDTSPSHLKATPWPRSNTPEPEAVELPLNLVAKQAVRLRRGEIKEHSGKVRKLPAEDKLHVETRHNNARTHSPSSTSPRRAQTTPVDSTPPEWNA